MVNRVGFHDLKSRKAGSEKLVELHLNVPRNMSVNEAHNIFDHIERNIRKQMKSVNVTIHVEPYDID